MFTLAKIILIWIRTLGLDCALDPDPDDISRDPDWALTDYWIGSWTVFVDNADPYQDSNHDRYPEPYLYNRDVISDYSLDLLCYPVF